MMMRTTLVTFSKMFGLSVLTLTLLLSNSSLAAERKIETTVLAKSTQDWGGSTLDQYADGQPEVTVARVTIPAGMALPLHEHCLLYTSPSPRDRTRSRMPSSA